jgi:hypothetical protein
VCLNSSRFHPYEQREGALNLSNPYISSSLIGHLKTKPLKSGPPDFPRSPSARPHQPKTLFLTLDFGIYRPITFPSFLSSSMASSFFLFSPSLTNFSHSCTCTYLFSHNGILHLPPRSRNGIPSSTPRKQQNTEPTKTRPIRCKTGAVSRKWKQGKA